jgi:hypothetical protein
MMEDEITWTCRAHTADAHTQFRSDYLGERDRQKYLKLVQEYYWKPYCLNVGKCVGNNPTQNRLQYYFLSRPTTLAAPTFPIRALLRGYSEHSFVKIPLNHLNIYRHHKLVSIYLRWGGVICHNNI